MSICLKLFMGCEVQDVQGAGESGPSADPAEPLPSASAERSLRGTVIDILREPLLGLRAMHAWGNGVSVLFGPVGKRQTRNWRGHR